MEDSSIYLAPLQEFTDHIYRNAFKKHFLGIDKYFTPYVNLENDGSIKSRQRRDVRVENNDDICVIPQFLPSNGDEMRTLLQNIDLDFYPEINLNLGCPYPMVTRKGRGSALLRNKPDLEEILQVCFERENLKVSIKMRLGLEENDEYKEIVDLLNKFPLEEVILHPRNAKQLYKGIPDRSSFGDFYSKIRTNPVYNGDINTNQEYDDLLSEFPTLRRVMLGRGVLMNPFLGEEIIGEQKNDSSKSVRLADFHDAMFAGMSDITEGDNHLLRKMLTFWTYYSFAFSNQRKAFKLIKKAKNTTNYHFAVRDIFNDFI